jgi:hypothetical protein
LEKNKENRNPNELCFFLYQLWFKQKSLNKDHNVHFWHKIFRKISTKTTKLNFKTWITFKILFLRFEYFPVLILKSLALPLESIRVKNHNPNWIAFLKMQFELNMNWFKFLETQFESIRIKSQKIIKILFFLIRQEILHKNIHNFNCFNELQ